MYLALEARLKSILATHQATQKNVIVRKKLPLPLSHMFTKGTEDGVEEMRTDESHDDGEKPRDTVLEALGYSHCDLLMYSRPGVVDIEDIKQAIALEPSGISAHAALPMEVMPQNSGTEDKNSSSTSTTSSTTSTTPPNQANQLFIPIAKSRLGVKKARYILELNHLSVLRNTT